MVSIIADNLEGLRRLCEEHGVRTLWLFGSAVRDGAEICDVDAVVEFQEMNFRERADRYYSLRSAMTKLFGRPVDLIEEGAIENPYFRREVDRSRVRVYAA